MKCYETVEQFIGGYTFVMSVKAHRIKQETPLDHFFQQN